MKQSKMVFGCTALLGTNLTGNLPRDADGQYEVVLGALNFKNSVGHVYPEKPALELLHESSGFMRRLKGAYCKGEYGHPKQQPGQGFQDYLRRILTIEETMVSHLHTEVWIDRVNMRGITGPVIATMGKVIPTGPYGAVLEKSLNTPKENVAFSIRSITDDYRNGVNVEKHLREIVCWDTVTEPGISVANKFQAPALESMNNDVMVSEHMLIALAEDTRGQCISMEARSIVAGILHKNRERNRIFLSGMSPSSEW